MPRRCRCGRRAGGRWSYASPPASPVCTAIARARPRCAIGTSSSGSSPTTAIREAGTRSRAAAARSAASDGLPVIVSRQPVTDLIIAEIARDVPSARPPAAGGTPANTTVTYAIAVLQPVVLSATFHNSGTTAALNVTVSWYVDKALVGTSTIAQIAANSDATVTFDYLPAGLSAGPHTVMVTADLDHDGVINQARGEVATSTLFYNQAVPPAPGWIILVGLAVFLPVLLGMVALRRRGQR